MTALVRREFVERWDSTPVNQRRLLLAQLGATTVTQRYATPGALAQALDASIIQTPAFEIIDQHLLRVAEAIECMYDRRSLLARYVREGLDKDFAADRVADEIPQRGITRLVISMPPQEGKSTRVSRHFVEWGLQRFPALRVAIVSYDGSKASDFTYEIRADIEQFNGDNGNIDLGLRLMPDDKAKSRWRLVTGGSAYAVGIGGGLTGRPVDAMDIDDPVKDYRDADSQLKSENAWKWWQTVGRPRLAPGAPVVAMATRWAEDDLLGRFMSKQAEDEASGVENTDRWTVLNIAAEADYDAEAGESDPLGRQPGEFMVSARGRTRDDWEAIKAGVDDRYWFAMYQGRPASSQGNIFMREWWRRSDEILWTQRPDGSFVVNGWELWQSWDFTFRGTAGTDFVVGQVWATKGADSVLVTQVRARLSFTQTLDAVKRVARLFPQSGRKLVEAKANGDAVIDTLRKEIPGIIPVTPDNSKEARARAVTPFVRSGNVLLPTTRVATAHPDLAFDVDSMIAETLVFPNGAHDDQVDAMTQFLRERYLELGTTQVLSPVGLGARSKVPGGQRISPMAQRLAAQRGKESA